MVRRRRNECNARRGVAHVRDFVGNFMPRQLPAFARLGALGHLYLNHLRVSKVFYRYAEPAAGDLLDCAVERIAVALIVSGRVLAAFAGVAHRAQTIHGKGNCFVGFLADRSVRHRARAEAFDDFLGRGNFLQRNGLLRSYFKQPAECAVLLRLIVNQFCVLCVGLGIVCPDGALE